MTPPALVIAGSGRSGTTWVLDAIAQPNDLRTIFEPLHPHAIAQARPYANRYIPEDKSEPGLRAYLESVWDGSYRSLWTDFRVRSDRVQPNLAMLHSLQDMRRMGGRWKKIYQNVRRYRRVVRRQRIIVKFIRANLMLGWLQKNFGARIVLLTRHPVSVVESKMRLGGKDWDPYPALAGYLNDRTLQTDYGRLFNPIAGEDLSPAEAHAAIWCIENQIPINELACGRGVLVFYEKLLENPDVEWRRIADGLGLSNVPDRAMVARPSQQSSVQWIARDSACASSVPSLDDVSSAILRDVDGILRTLGVSIYGAYDPMPRLDVAA